LGFERGLAKAWARDMLVEPREYEAADPRVAWAMAHARARQHPDSGRVLGDASRRGPDRATVHLGSMYLLERLSNAVHENIRLLHGRKVPAGGTFFEIHHLAVSPLEPTT